MRLICEACGRTHDLPASVRVFVCHCQQPVSIPPGPTPQQLWASLHRYPVRWGARWSAARTARWFERWLANVRSYGCGSCSHRFRAYCLDCPPDFSAPGAFFRWSVVAHNHVSTEHVSPPRQSMSVNDAARVWGANFGEYEDGE